MLKQTLLGATAAVLFAGAASAGEPVKLTDSQMDQVNAGLNLFLGLAVQGGATSAGFTNFTANETTLTGFQDTSVLNSDAIAGTTSISSGIIVQAGTGQTYNGTGGGANATLTTNGALSLSGQLTF